MEKATPFAEEVLSSTREGEEEATPPAMQERGESPPTTAENQEERQGGVEACPGLSSDTSVAEASPSHLPSEQSAESSQDASKPSDHEPMEVRQEEPAATMPAANVSSAEVDTSQPVSEDSGGQERGVDTGEGSGGQEGDVDTGEGSQPASGGQEGDVDTGEGSQPASESSGGQKKGGEGSQPAIESSGVQERGEEGLVTDGGDASTVTEATSSECSRRTGEEKDHESFQPSVQAPPSIATPTESTMASVVTVQTPPSTATPTESTTASLVAVSLVEGQSLTLGSEEMVITCPRSSSDSTPPSSGSTPSSSAPKPVQGVVMSTVSAGVSGSSVTTSGTVGVKVLPGGMPSFATVACTMLTAATPVIATPSAISRQPQPPKKATLPAGLSPTLSSNLAALFPSYAGKFASSTTTGSRGVAVMGPAHQDPGLSQGAQVLISAATPPVSGGDASKGSSATTSGSGATSVAQLALQVATPPSSSSTRVQSAGGDSASQSNAIPVIAHVPVLKGTPSRHPQGGATPPLAQILREKERIAVMPTASKLKVDKAEMLHPPSEIQQITPKEAIAGAASAPPTAAVAPPTTTASIVGSKGQVYTVDLSQFTIPKVTGMQTVPPAQKFGGHKIKEEPVPIKKLLNTPGALSSGGPGATGVTGGGTTSGGTGGGAQGGTGKQPQGMLYFKV